MSKKTKLMMTVLGIVCVLSLVANAFLLTRSNKTESEGLTAQVEQLNDSISKIDSINKANLSSKDDSINILNERIRKGTKVVSEGDNQKLFDKFVKAISEN